MEEENYQALLKKEVLDPSNNLNSTDRKRFLIWLINDASINLQTTKEEKSSLRTLFQLYQYGIEHSLLFEYKQISLHTFYNFITVSNLLGEFDYSKSFIEQFVDFLPVQNKASAKNWAWAHWYFHSGRLDDCLGLIARAFKKYHLFSLQIRVLEIKAQYKQCQINQDPSDFFESRLINALQWVRTDRSLSSYNKTVFMNFIKMMKKINQKYNEPQVDSKDKQELLEALEEIKEITSRAWLVQQINDL